MFALGVVGAILFSVSMVSFAAFAKLFGDGTFEQQDPRTVLWLPLALVVLFFVRGLGDFTQTYCMGYVGRQIVKLLRAQAFERLVNLSDRLLRPHVHARAAFATHVQHGADRSGDYGFSRRHGPRAAHDHGLDRVSLLHEHASHAHRAHDGGRWSRGW